MRRIQFLFWLAGSLLVLPCGCSDSTGGSSDGPIICDEHIDCPLGWYCGDGLCVPGTTSCNDDIDCPGTMVCINGACTIEHTDGGLDGGADGGDAGEGGEPVLEWTLDLESPPFKLQEIRIMRNQDMNPRSIEEYIE